MNWLQPNASAPAQTGPSQASLSHAHPLKDLYVTSRAKMRSMYEFAVDVMTGFCLSLGRALKSIRMCRQNGGQIGGIGDRAAEPPRPTADGD
jgi:hypothetical protein